MQGGQRTEQTTVEYRVVGPPGCGKTTWLGAQVEQAVESGMSVLISSLTKAAVTEIGGRACPSASTPWAPSTPTAPLLVAPPLQGHVQHRVETGPHQLQEGSPAAGPV